MNYPAPQTPRKMLDDTRLSPNDLLTYRALTSFVSRAKPTQQAIAHRAHLSVRTVQRCLADLRNLGYLPEVKR